MLSSKHPLEVGTDFFVLGDRDLRDQPIESQPDGRIADAIAGGDVFQRARRQDQALNKGEVLVAQVVQPAALSTDVHDV